MAVLDTSTLLAAYQPDESHHETAKQRLESAPVWRVTGGVLAELTQTIRRKANMAGLDGDETARLALQHLRQASRYRFTARCDDDLLARIYTTHPALSYVDAWGVALAVDLQEPLVTLDRRQADALERLR